MAQSLNTEAADGGAFGLGNEGDVLLWRRITAGQRRAIRLECVGRARVSLDGADVEHLPRFESSLRIKRGEPFLELAGQGVLVEPVRVDPHTGNKFTFFADPDGLPLELYER